MYYMHPFAYEMGWIGDDRPFRGCRGGKELFKVYCTWNPLSKAMSGMKETSGSSADKDIMCALIRSRLFEE